MIKYLQPGMNNRSSRVRLVEWDSFYSVQVEEIDEQHKKLIQLINKMYDAMRNGKGNDVLGAVLSELVEYTKYHFAAEENLLLEHSYPELEAHKKIHADLTARVKTYKDQFECGNDSSAMDIMLFLSNWLNVHILEVDKIYISYLKSSTTP